MTDVQAAMDADEKARQTVEAAVRAQLSKALGGGRGIAEGAVPTVLFTATWLITHDLRLSVGLGVGSAVLLLAIRLLQRSTVQFVFNSLVGIGIAAFFALRTGKAEDAFLPGILYNAFYSVVLIGSIIGRWPVVGFIIGSVTGDPTEWRRDPAIVRLCARLTWLLVLPCVLRVVVQYPLYLAGLVGWLGTAKIALGWPLQIASFGAMVWVLARGRTPMTGTAAPEAPEVRGSEVGGSEVRGSEVRESDVPDAGAQEADVRGSAERERSDAERDAPGPDGKRA